MSSRTPAKPVDPASFEFTVDRASKCYEPGEKVTGQVTFKDFKYVDIE